MLFWDHVLNWSTSFRIISATGKFIDAVVASRKMYKSLLFSSVGKRSALHIGEECMSIFGISFMFPHNSVYTKRLNDAILRFSAHGIILKITNEMQWDLQRSDTGRLLQTSKHKKFSFADVEERKLNLADTEGLLRLCSYIIYSKLFVYILIHSFHLGMFLLMGIGYLVAVSVLVSEIVGGCARRCREFAQRKSRSKSVVSPYPSKRPSYVSESDEPPLSAQQKFRRIVLKRFRRHSEPISANEALQYRRGHKRADSIFVSADPATSFGEAELAVNERWDELKRESDIDEMSSQNEIVESGGSSHRSHQESANRERSQVFDIEAQGYLSTEDEFGEIVKH